METPLPTIEDIDELLVFLPKLYADGFKALTDMHIDEYPDGSISFPRAEYDPLVYTFIDVASKSCWTDYQYDPEHTGLMLEGRNLIENASLEQIKTMMTYCVRGERFCEGHWGAMIEQGKFKALLERLMQLREHK